MNKKNQKPLFLRTCRQMTGLNAESFIHRHAFNKQAYLRLERGESYLRDEISDKILRALALEGVFVSKQWILDGTGEPPKKVQKEDFSLQKNEIEVFKNRKNSFVLFIKNDDMKPFYVRGDYVGGVFLKDKRLCHNKRCIVSFSKKTYVAHIIIINELIITLTYKDFIFEIVDIIRGDEDENLLLAPIIFVKKQETENSIEEEDQENFLENDKKSFLEAVG